MKKTDLKLVKINKNRSLFNYEKKILINELTLELKLGYYDFEKEKPQKVKFSLEIDYQDKKPTNDKDIKSIVNYGTVVKLITPTASISMSRGRASSTPTGRHSPSPSESAQACLLLGRTQVTGCS